MKLDKSPKIKTAEGEEQEILAQLAALDESDKQTRIELDRAVKSLQAFSGKEASNKAATPKKGKDKKAQRGPRGKEQDKTGVSSEKVQVPVMITKSNEQELRELGLSQEEINKLTPEKAWEIISTSIKIPREQEKPEPVKTAEGKKGNVSQKIAEEEVVVDPKTPEEKEIVKEIENLPEKDKKRLGYSFKIWGFAAEEMKNDLFASTFGLITKKLDKKSTTGRFFSELRDSFVKDRDEAIRKQWEIQEGKDTKKTSQVKDKALLVGNLLKYGRLLTDFTGLTPGSVQRFLTAAGMATARLSEAAKEAHLKSEGAMEKTRIDSDKAFEEAWKIYDTAKKEAGNKKVSIEDLKKAYLTEMPKDLQERLKDPEVAFGFAQNLFRNIINARASRLNKKVEEIEKSSKSDAEKKSETDILLKDWKKELEDYDRMLTQYGTVDQIAVAAKSAQYIGKGVVLTMQAQSIYRLWGLMHHIDFHAMHNPFAHKTPEVTTPHTPSQNNLPVQPGIKSIISPVSDFHGASITFEHGHGGIKGIKDLQEALQKQYPDISKAPQGVQDFVHTDATKEAMKLGLYDPNSSDESALIKAGSILKMDEHGNILFGKLDHLGKIDEHGWKMFHSGHPDVLQSTPENTPINADNYVPGQPLNVHTQQIDNSILEHHQVTKIPTTSTEEIRNKLLENYQNKPKVGDVVPGTGRVTGEGQGGYNYSWGPQSQYQENFTRQIQHIPHIPGITSNDLRGISPKDTDFILKNLDVVGKNPEHLSGVKLINYIHSYQENLKGGFKSDHAYGYGTVKNLMPSKMLGNVKYENSEEYHPTMKYIHQLIDTTGVKPKGGGLFSKPETVDQYVKRALAMGIKKGISPDQLKLE